jgi:hypothetical protein
MGVGSLRGGGKERVIEYDGMVELRSQLEINY